MTYLAELSKTGTRGRLAHSDSPYCRDCADTSRRDRVVDTAMVFRGEDVARVGRIVQAPFRSSRGTCIERDRNIDGSCVEDSLPILAAGRALEISGRKRDATHVAENHRDYSDRDRHLLSHR